MKKESFYMREGGDMQAFWGEKWSCVKGTSVLKNVVKVFSIIENLRMLILIFNIFMKKIKFYCILYIIVK